MEKKNLKKAEETKNPSKKLELAVEVTVEMSIREIENTSISKKERLYRRAIEKWKEENPNTNCIDIPKYTEVEIDGKMIKIGNRIHNLKAIYSAMEKGKHLGNYKDLTEEEIAYWKNHGIFEKKKRKPKSIIISYKQEIPTEQVLLRKAVEKWKEKNPDKDYRDIPLDAIVMVDGTVVQVGQKLIKLRRTYTRMLSDEEIEYWNQLGIFEPKELVLEQPTPKVITNKKKENSSSKTVKQDKEELYRRAIEKWKEENSSTNYIDISKDAVVTIDEKEVPIGNKIHRLRAIFFAMENGKHFGNYKDLTEEEISYWQQFGIFEKKKVGRQKKLVEKQPVVKETIDQETLWRAAIEKWKEENPNVDYIDIPKDTMIKIDGKEISIGNRVKRMQFIYNAMQQGKHHGNYKDLTEEEIAYWKPLGIFEKPNREEQRKEKKLLYRKAIEKWKEENPQIDYIDIPKDAVVTIDEKTIPIGRRIQTIRDTYSAMQKGKHFGNYKDLTEEEIAYWKPLGIFGERKKGRKETVKKDPKLTSSQEERRKNKESLYRSAIEKWKEENPEMDYIDISADTVIEIDGKDVTIGNRIKRMRLIYNAMQKGKRYGNYKDLTEEEIAYWKPFGIFENQKKSLAKKEQRREKELLYRSAIEKWQEEHPNIDCIDIPDDEVVTINEQEIPIGNRVKHMRFIYSAMQKGKHHGCYTDLTEEEISYWKTFGIFEKKQRKTSGRSSTTLEKIRQEKEINYRKAIEKWKEENPNTNYLDIPVDTVIEIDGTDVTIGNRIKRMRLIYNAMQNGKHYGNYKDLTEEEITYWKPLGIFEKRKQKKVNSSQEERRKNNETLYRSAIEKWKEENPDIDYIDIPENEVVTINEQEIPIGGRIKRMRLIYNAMQKGKRYGNYKNLTEEEIAYWEPLGIFKLKRNCREKNQANTKGTSKEQLYRQAIEKWKEENPEIDYIDIPKDATVTIDEKTVPIGMRVQTMRKIYSAMQKGKKNGGCRDLTEEEIAYWKPLGIFGKRKIGRKETIKKVPKITPQEKRREKELLFRSAIEQWKKENPAMEYIDIPVDTVVMINDKKVSIGRRVQIIRSIHHAMQKGKQYLKYDNLTVEELSYWKSLGVLAPKKRKNAKLEKSEQQKEKITLYKQALKKWKSENKTKSYSEISENEVVELDNQQIKIGNYIQKAKEAHEMRKKGKKVTFISEEELTYLESIGVFKKTRNTPKQNSESQVPIKQQARYQKIKETLRILKEYNQESKVFYLEDIKKVFQIDLEVFQAALEKLELENKNINKTIPTDIYQTIRSYCLQNGYNPDSVTYLLKFHKIFKDEPIEQLVERVLKLKQKTLDSENWVYDKYGIRILDILSTLDLRETRVIADMVKNIVPLEEALKKEIFSKNCIGKKEYVWLENLYNGIVSQLVNYTINKNTTKNALEIYDWEVDSCSLTSEESKFLLHCFKDYVKTVSECRILEVGLESNRTQKIKKILSYCLTFDDIEESYTQALMFDKGHPIEENSKLYQRRQLIRQYVIDWEYYSNEEKEKLRNSGYFTKKEIELIQETRNQIDEMINEIQRRRNHMIKMKQKKI